MYPWGMIHNIFYHVYHYFIDSYKTQNKHMKLQKQPCFRVVVVVVVNFSH